MGDIVERELDGTIPVLHAAQRAKLLNRREVSDIVRKRRHHEYNLLRKNVSRTDYLHYAAFERELHAILKRRAKQRGLEKLQVERTVDKTAARVNLIYSRACQKFRFDDDLWLHYAKHCIKNGSTRAAARVFAKAIAYRNNSERIWLAAVAFHFDTNSDATGGRTLAQRALRACPTSVKLWKEYFRLELCFLGKLVARRLAIGLRPDASEGNEQYSALKPSEKQSLNSEHSPEQDESSGDKESGYNASAENNSDIAQKNMSHDNQQSETIEKVGSKPSESVADPASSSSLESELQPIVIANEVDAMDTSKMQKPTERPNTTSDSDGIELDEGENSGEESDNSSSGAEDSDEQSVNSESSSDGNSTNGLSFWDGGVPFAVFRNAFNRLKLSYLDRAEFWDVAASTPFVPPKLLSHMLSFMKASYTNCCVIQAISIREPWDVDRSTRKRSLGKKIGGENGEIYLSESDKVALSNHALKVTELLHTAISSADFSQLPDSEAVGVRSVLQGFSNLVQNTCSSAKFEEASKHLLSVFEVHQGKSMLDVEGPEPRAGSSQQDMRQWKVAKFESLLQESSDGFNASEEFYEALKQKVIVPFRSLEQDRLGCLYLSKETDISNLRNFTKAVLAVPPVTMDSLKAAINAELRIFVDSRKQDATTIIHQTDEVMVSHTRKLFKRATSLPAARRDVDLWLSYVDFERSVAADMKEASSASWKATKVLMPSFQESFTERQTLRNLGR